MVSETVTKHHTCADCGRSFLGAYNRTLCRFCRTSHTGSKEDPRKLEQREIGMYAETGAEKGIRKSQAWRDAVERAKRLKSEEAAS